MLERTFILCLHKDKLKALHCYSEMLSKFPINSGISSCHCIKEALLQHALD